MPTKHTPGTYEDTPASAGEVLAGAKALWDSYPTLREDFTFSFYVNAAQAVLVAAFNARQQNS